MPYDYSFDANQFEPTQGGGPHPPGKFPATISATEIKPTKNNDGGMFIVTFKTDQGTIAHRYNLWNSNAKAVEIAHKELSALCHAIGIFKLDMKNDAAAIIGSRLMIEVGQQKDTEYMEVKHIYCADGSEPGKAPAQPQAGSGWGNPNQPSQNPAPQQSAPSAPQGNGNGWGPAPSGAAPQQQSPQGNGAAPAWSPGPTQQQPQQPSNPPAGGGAPPWARS